jgi:hypothetical protein
VPVGQNWHVADLALACGLPGAQASSGLMGWPMAAHGLLGWGRRHVHGASNDGLDHEHEFTA